ncbi:MAG: hypothetical protein HPY71_03830 [Firmicutes bacterium]|nr:hypothetical protein [Bacillota bacterium]
MRVGPGEYTTPEGQKAEAQSFFLIAVERLAPEVLKALAEEVYPCYQGEDMRYVPDSLRAALDAWMQKFHIKADWILEQALDTMSLWRQYPPVLKWEPLEWGIIALGPAEWYPVPKEEQRLIFHSDGWHIDIETRGQARDRLMSEFKAYLEEYLNYVEAIAGGRGWTRTFEKRGRSARGKPDLHFEWLVRHQVQGWTCERIAEEYGGEDQWLDPASVWQGIRETAELIGLRLRTLPKGRKRKG